MLWSHGPCALKCVVDEISRERPAVSSTIATQLGLMRAKRLVTRSAGKGKPTWSARVNRDDTRTGLIKRLIDRAFDGSAHSLVTHLVDRHALSDDDRRALRELVAESESDADLDHDGARS